MDKEFSREFVCALAAEIVERIVNDPALSDALADRLAGYTCPPGQLCCDVGYGCDSPFVCRPGFDCMKSFANYPP